MESAAVQPPVNISAFKQQWGFSVIKTIPIHESMNAQFQAEFFNIFYNVNSLLPVNDISSPKFTQISAARPDRVAQWVLRFSF
jgi:hypothetical protein